ncbi:MAG TPA: hypothetical protein VM734_01510 [Kofleriaceae bacterium]|jgi:hypothetical protein|nr:hypothetical protein [Kofleriaceae bacterium]
MLHIVKGSSLFVVLVLAVAGCKSKKEAGADSPATAPAQADKPTAATTPSGATAAPRAPAIKGTSLSTNIGAHAFELVVPDVAEASDGDDEQKRWDWSTRDRAYSLTVWVWEAYPVSADEVREQLLLGSEDAVEIRQDRIIAVERHGSNGLSVHTIRKAGAAGLHCKAHAEATEGDTLDFEAARPEIEALCATLAPL